MRSHLTGILIILLQTAMVQAQATRSVVQVFNPAGFDQVVLDLVGDVEILTAPGQLIQVETEVVLSNAGDPILKALIMARRYNLESSREAESLELFYRQRLAPVSVRGKTLDEHVRYRVYLPVGIEAVMKDRTSMTTSPE